MSEIAVLESIEAVRQRVSSAKALGSVALIPTMGALHEGHLSLVRAAKKICPTVVVSIFVNPMQFGAGEDFDRYPRELNADVRKLELENIDVVFAPSVGEMYPSGSAGSIVDVPAIAYRLDGRSRAGHFRGVSTVVAKLFHIVLPDYAFFGQKDAAQVAVLRAVIRDLNFPVKLFVCPTVRESDGLAMSSRNQYLDSDERLRARLLYRALTGVRAAASRGLNDAATLRKLMHSTIQSDSAIRLDYAEIVDPNTLLPIEDISGGALIAIAAWVGETRLIDNIVLPDLEPSSCG